MSDLALTNTIANSVGKDESQILFSLKPNDALQDETLCRTFPHSAKAKLHTLADFWSFRRSVFGKCCSSQCIEVPILGSGFLELSEDIEFGCKLKDAI